MNVASRNCCHVACTSVVANKWISKSSRSLISTFNSSFPNVLLCHRWNCYCSSEASEGNQDGIRQVTDVNHTMRPAMDSNVPSIDSNQETLGGTSSNVDAAIDKVTDELADLSTDILTDTSTGTFIDNTLPRSLSTVQLKHLIFALEKQLLISHPNIEWFHVSYSDIKRLSHENSELKPLLSYWRTKSGRNILVSLMKKIYMLDNSDLNATIKGVPEEEENDFVSPFSEENSEDLESLFKTKRKRSKQRWLFHYLKNIFRVDNVSFEPGFTREVTLPLQSNEGMLQNILLRIENQSPIHLHFLITLPTGKLIAIHYLTSAHFQDLYHDAPLEIIMLKDEERRTVCKQADISLVEIPYNWDTTIDTLKQIISKSLIESNSPNQEDSLDKTRSFTENHSIAHNETRETNEQILQVQKPGVWNRKEDVKGWWLSKKYDGIRAICRDGKLFTKQNKPIPLPPNLQSQVSKFSLLDGELVSNNGGYALITSIIKQGQIGVFTDEEWKNVRFMVFDYIEPNMTFEERQVKLKETFSPLNQSPFIQLVSHTKLLSNEALLTMLEELNPTEEGFILVKPHSHYIFGRTNNVLKAKKLYDSEVLFLGRTENGFQVRLPNGFVMSARVSNEDYEYPNYVPEQTVFTIMYSQVNQVSGNPVKPMIFRERKDLTWHDVLNIPSPTLPPQTSSSLMDIFERTTESTDFSNAAPKTKQNILNEVIKASTDSFPYPHEVPIIAEKLQVTDTEAVSMLRRARLLKRSPSLQLTSSVKSRIQQWMEKDPSGQHRNTLLKELGLSRLQLSRQVYILKNSKVGNISESTKKVIKDWLKMNNYEYPNQKQREQLQKELNISTRQLCKQIDLLKQDKGTVDEMSKAILYSWYEQNKSLNPTKGEREQLLKKTGWNRHQLNKQLQILRDQPGEITETAKHFISAWLNKNQRTPTKTDREFLRQQTGLSNQQIIGQIRSMVSHSKRITPEGKDIIRKWLQEHPNTAPSSEDRDLFQQQTGFTRVQVNNIIHRELNKNGTISEKVHQLVDAWLQKENYRNPSTAEKKELCEAAKIGLNQLSSLIRYKRKRYENMIMVEKYH